MNIISITYKLTPLSVRNAFAFGEDEKAVFFERLQKKWEEITQCVILSTCNRLELYFDGRLGICRDVSRFLCEQKQLSYAAVAKYINIYHGDRAITHLIRVACGVDSMVLGEDEILRQLKEAYASAHDNGRTAFELNTIFQMSIQAAKEIKTRTGISETPVSIGTLAANEVSALPIRRKRVLVLGITGRIGGIVARNLLCKKDIEVIGTYRGHKGNPQTGVDKSRVCELRESADGLWENPEERMNRELTAGLWENLEKRMYRESTTGLWENPEERMNQESTAGLWENPEERMNRESTAGLWENPQELGGARVRRLPFSRRYEAMEAADVVISATSSPHFTVTAEDFLQKVKTDRERLFIDLAVPNDIDEEIGRMPGCRLINIDYFDQLSAENNRRKREKARTAEKNAQEWTDEIAMELRMHELVRAIPHIEQVIQRDGVDKLIYSLRRYSNRRGVDEVADWLEAYLGSE